MFSVEFNRKIGGRKVRTQNRIIPLTDIIQNQFLWQVSTEEPVPLTGEYSRTSSSDRWVQQNQFLWLVSTAEPVPQTGEYSRTSSSDRWVQQKQFLWQVSTEEPVPPSTLEPVPPTGEYSKTRSSHRWVKHTPFLWQVSTAELVPLTDQYSRCNSDRWVGTEEPVLLTVEYRRTNRFSLKKKIISRPI